MSTTHPFETAGFGTAPFRFLGYYESKYQAVPGAPDCPIQPGSCCDYCGQSIMIVCRVQGATGDEFKVGQDCVRKVDAPLAKRVDRAMSERAKVKRTEKREIARESARQSREARREQSRADALAKHPGLDAALATDHPIVRDIAKRFSTYGSLSDAQIRLVFKIAAEGAKPVEVNVAAPEGRVQFKGTIISVKSEEMIIGYARVISYKMTVKVSTPEGTWLAWGTCPEAIMQESTRHLSDEHQCGIDWLKGRQIELTATLKRGREEHFALLSRPSKARILDGRAYEPGCECHDAVECPWKRMAQKEAV